MAVLLPTARLAAQEVKGANLAPLQLPGLLQRFVQLPPSRLEQLEQLEQLRALEAGMCIAVGEVGCASTGIDTPEDLWRLERRWDAASEERRAARTL